MWRGRQERCRFVHSVASLVTFLPHHVCARNCAPYKGAVRNCRNFVIRPPSFLSCHPHTPVVDNVWGIEFSAGLSCLSICLFARPVTNNIPRNYCTYIDHFPFHVSCETIQCLLPKRRVDVMFDNTKFFTRKASYNHILKFGTLYSELPI